MSTAKEEKYRALYETTYGKAYYIAGKYLKNDQDIQDVLQDSYLKAFSALEKEDNISDTQAWINRIVHNTALDFLKKKQPLYFSELTSEDEDSSIDFEDESPTFNPEKITDWIATASAVNEVISQLDEKYQLVLFQYYGQDFSVREIAELSGCSENSVKTRLKRGREQLLAKKDEFRKRGIEISIIPIAVLLKLAFIPETAYAATASSAVFAAAYAGATGETALGGGGAVAAASTAGSSSTSVAGGAAVKAAGTGLAAKAAAVGTGVMIAATAAVVGPKLRPLSPEEKAGAKVIQEIAEVLDTEGFENNRDIIMAMEDYYLLVDLCDENGGSWIYTGSGANGGIYKVKTPVEYEDYLEHPYNKFNYFLYLGEYKGTKREGSGKLLGFYEREYLSAFPYYAEGEWKADYPNGEMYQLLMYPMESITLKGNVSYGKWEGITELKSIDPMLKLDGVDIGGHWSIPFEKGKLVYEPDGRLGSIIGENEDGLLILDDYEQEYLNYTYGIIDEREECEYFPKYHMFTTMEKKTD